MNKFVILIGVVLIAFLGFGIFNQFIYQQKQAPASQDQKDNKEQTDQITGLPTDEQAELTGFGFVQDFIKSAPPASDSIAQNRAYATLSIDAKKSVSKTRIGNDLAKFFGVQDVPDQGVSVEDLQKPTEDTAKLIVGLNYSGSGRVLKAINMVIENGEWKVDKVEPLESYPHEN